MKIIDIKRLRPGTRLHHSNIIHPRERIRQHGLNHRRRDIRRRERKNRRSDFLPVALAKPSYEDGALRGDIGRALLKRQVAAEVEVLEREGLVGGCWREGGGAGVGLDGAAGEDCDLGGVGPDTADEVQGERDREPGVEGQVIVGEGFGLAEGY